MADTSVTSRINTSRPIAPSTWRASQHYTPLPPPPIDPEIDAPPKMGPDGRIIKKVRPRRTVDLWAGVGRWEMVSNVPEIAALYWSDYFVVDKKGETSGVSCTCSKACCIVHCGRMYFLYSIIMGKIVTLPQMLPPKAYPDNAATSITTKFVHTSTNKVRCPVNCVAVSLAALIHTIISN